VRSGDGIAEAIESSPPAAILLDLSSFRYRGGDYISGFLEAFLDKGHGRARPACFVSSPRGVKSLFDAIDPSGTFGVRYFQDRAEASRVPEGSAGSHWLTRACTRRRPARASADSKQQRSAATGEPQTV